MSRFWSGWDCRPKFIRTRCHRISPEGVPAMPFTCAWQVTEVSSSRRYVSCTSWLFSLLKCTHLRRWKHHHWVFWLFLCLRCFFVVVVLVFWGVFAMVSLEHKLLLQQSTVSSPLAWIRTSLFILYFSHKALYKSEVSLRYSSANSVPSFQWSEALSFYF